MSGPTPTNTEATSGQNHHSLPIHLPVAFSTPSQLESYSLPSIDWLQATWHVTHSTWSRWSPSKRRNVCYNYSALPDKTNAVRDVVTYHGLYSTKVKKIQGISSVTSDKRMRWEGTGVLSLLGQKCLWDVMGFGEMTVDVSEERRGEISNKWMVIYYEKTMFSPQGMSILSSSPSGLSEKMLVRIKEDLKNLGGDIGELSTTLFRTKIDGGR